MSSILEQLEYDHIETGPSLSVVGGNSNRDRASDQPVRVLALRSIDGQGGGAESLLLRTAPRLDPNRVRMTVCCIRRPNDLAYCFDRQAAELGIDYCEVFQRSILARGVLSALRTIVRQRRPAIIDAQDYKAAFFAYWLARTEAVRPISTLHGWNGCHWRERLIYHPAEKLIVRAFPLVIAVSSEIRNEMLRWRCGPNNLRVLLNGIDPCAFRRMPGLRAKMRDSLGFAPTDVVLGSLARLEGEKRLDVLLDALALLPHRPEVKLLIVGDGSLRGELEDRSRRLGLEKRCRFLGYRKDIRELYHSMDVYVQSSDYEGTPTVLVEAMAMEVPVVATDVGGTRELIEDGVHGLLVPRRDPGALAAAIQRSLDDREATARRIAAAHSRVEHELTFANRTRRLEDVYLEVAHDGRLTAGTDFCQEAYLPLGEAACLSS